MILFYYFLWYGAPFIDVFFINCGHKSWGCCCVFLYILLDFIENFMVYIFYFFIKNKTSILMFFIFIRENNIPEILDDKNTKYYIYTDFANANLEFSMLIK